ncbi:hypothetical protein PAMP_023805 [Pampus punctatissimus]
MRVGQGGLLASQVKSKGLVCMLGRGKLCKVFRTVVTPPLCADMSVVVSAVMNALVVCWREERLIGTSLPPAIRSSSPAGGRGSPLLFNRSTPEKVSALECESGWSPVRPICVYTATLQCCSSSSLVQISYIYLLTQAAWPPKADPSKEPPMLAVRVLCPVRFPIPETIRNSPNSLYVQVSLRSEHHIIFVCPLRSRLPLNAKPSVEAVSEYECGP